MIKLGVLIFAVFVNTFNILLIDNRQKKEVYYICTKFFPKYEFYLAK